MAPKNSILNKKIGQKIYANSIYGGWPPHVHFQLSKPKECDLQYL